MDSPFLVESRRDFPPCPVCHGHMDVVYSRHGENVLVCVDCHTGLTIPKNAWSISAVKKAQRVEKPDEKAG